MGPKPEQSRRLKPSQLRLTAIVLGLIIALGGIATSLLWSAPDVADNFARFWPLAFAGFPIMGALVLWRRRVNRIGLIMLWIGVAAGIPLFMTAAAVKVTDPRLSAILERIGNSIPIDWILVIALLAVFPSGSISSPTLKWLLRILFAWTPIVIALAIVSDVPLPATGRDNPLAVPALRTLSEAAIAGFAMVPVSAFVALLSIVQRWRGATGTDRLQYRWFAVGITLLVVGVGATGFLPWVNPVVNVGALVTGVNAVPVAIAIAVLRYRLFEIDRLVSRTVSYSVVIALLAGLYTLSIYVVQGMVGAESEFAVAGSTLVAAAAFNPIRRRVRAVVDRRFNRARFDAESEANAFAERLHQALDVKTVIDDLDKVLSQTVKPSTSSVWVRS